MSEDMIFRMVGPGEARRMVDAYRVAAVGAEMVRSILDAAGIDAVVVATVTEAGEPMVHVDVSGHRIAGAYRSGGARPPPDR